VIGLAASCRRALIVTTAEPTSIADAYATLKVLTREAPTLLPELLVNVVSGELEARSVFRRMDLLAERFLRVRPTLRGFVPRDPSLVRAVARQRAVVEAFPASPAARALAGLGEALWRDVREGTRRVRPMREQGASGPAGAVCDSDAEREGEGR
jgi:flagellar biosynthesis protein FlhG